MHARRWRRRAACGCAIVAAQAASAVLGCEHRDPPTPSASPSQAAPEREAPPRALGATDASEASDPARAGASSSGPHAAWPGADEARASADAAALDPADLPQTRDVPHTGEPAFQARVMALWDGVVEDAPERAMPFFFPLGAYAQVKDVANPAADWRHRLVSAYSQDIHDLHKRLSRECGRGGQDEGTSRGGGEKTDEGVASAGDASAGGDPRGHTSAGEDPRAHTTAGAARLGSCRFIEMDVPEARSRWVEPHEEYNKIGYYRVFGSKLRYAAAGAERAFDVKSLISWRGEWYVVHLSAIK